MRINFICYQYNQSDGYGRFGARIIAALMRQGVDVHPLLCQHTQMPEWMQQRLGIDWDQLKISCLPAYYLQPTLGAGRHWLLTMTEGSQLPDGWAEIINKSDVERVIVPCEANAQTFRNGGVNVPVHVVPGGTDPDEFPVLEVQRRDPYYTFLALADRGARKGWTEAWAAFYKAFGSPTDTPDVRLIIKSRPDGNELLSMIADADNPDPRIRIIMADRDMRGMYAQADCFVIPSRFEGWGMPHREAAMMGIPVITQRYSGMDDGYCHNWAIVVSGGRLEPIPAACEQIAGEWMRADAGQLANAMIHCYRNPGEVAQRAAGAAAWLRANQTWDHTAAGLLEILGGA